MPGLLAVVATLVAVLGFLGVVLLRATAPQPGEWSLRLGPTQRAFSAPVLLRWGTHPLVLPLLDGRELRTPAGRWMLRVDGNGSLHATCEPCVLRLRALGSAPLALQRVRVRAARAAPEAWRGTIELGPREDPVSIAWEAKLQTDGLAWRAGLAPTAIASLLRSLAEAPSAREVRVDGRFGFEANGLLNGSGFSRLQLKPDLEALHVSGLGTEALLAAAVPAACRPARAPIEGWLPRAVVAAEDQRFYEHPGFDLDETLVAWTSNQRQERQPGSGLRGGSTITQQLAKLIHTGDERSATRKLREWLHAVEMEHTLGKARILQLYLALAPWGDGLCGAEAASRHHLGKPASQLAPHEAAWLASLLVGPDAQLARWRERGRIDHRRVERIIEALRPMKPSRRGEAIEALQAWQPGPAAVGRPAPAQPHHAAVAKAPRE